jgi:hypothetical protein
MVIRDELEIWRMKRWFALAVVIAIAAAGWMMWPRHSAAPRARQYLNVSACLLTDQAGVNPGTPGASVWAAMESASLATHVMVSYLPDTGPTDITPMLNTLVQRKCAVIITAGAEASQVIGTARANPHQHFLLVAAGPGAAPAAPNTIIVTPAAASARIGQVIHALAAQA